MSLDALIARLEVATSRLENMAGVAGAPGGSAAGDGNVSASVEAFDEILNGSLKSFLDSATKIGGEVHEHAVMVEKAFRAQRDFLVVVANSKNPNDQTVLNNLVKPTADLLNAAVEFRDKHRAKGAIANHLAAVSEGIPALGWVLVSPKPAPHVAQMKESAEFYTNRVLKEFKDKDENHKNWAKAFPQLLLDLQEYVKKHHTTGLTWNPKGGDAAKAAPAPAPAPSAAPAAASAAPAKSDGAKDAKAGLFAALNKGEGVTGGLKKVSDDQKTHKNPALRAGAVVQAKEVTADQLVSKPSAGAGAGADKPPKFALENNKWAVEYQKDNKSIEISETEIKQVVYIYKCINSTIVIKGKVNQVTLDSCRKTAIVIDSVVSSVDVVNSQSIQMQITGKAPTVTIDKTDGVQLYLAKETLDVEILFAKSSEINVLAPGTNEDDDMRETALPEQLKAKWVGNKFVTEFVEHKG